MLVAQPIAQWRKAIKDDIQSINSAIGFCVDKQNSSIVMGISHDVDSAKRILLVKYDAKGVEQWRRIFQPNDGRDAVPVALTSDALDNVVLCGTIKNKSGNTDIVTAKYSPEGLLLWKNIFAGKANLFDAPLAIAIDRKNNVFVCGYETVSDANSDLLLIRYSTTGEASWMKNFSTSQMDVSVDVAVDDSCNVYVCGNINVAIRTSDIIVMKFDSLGIPRWNYVYDGAQHEVDMATDISVDDSTSIFVTGMANHSNERSDVVLLKLNRNGKLICEQLIGEGITDAIGDHLSVSKKTLLVHSVFIDYLQQTTSNSIYITDKSCYTKFKFNPASEDVTYLKAKDWKNNSILLFGTKLVRPENTVSPYIELRDSLRKNKLEYTDNSLYSLIRIKDIQMIGKDIYFLGDDATDAAGTITLAKYSFPEEPKKKQPIPTSNLIKK